MQLLMPTKVTVAQGSKGKSLYFFHSEAIAKSEGSKQTERAGRRYTEHAPMVVHLYPKCCCPYLPGNPICSLWHLLISLICFEKWFLVCCPHLVGVTWSNVLGLSFAHPGMKGCLHWSMTNSKRWLPRWAGRSTHHRQHLQGSKGQKMRPLLQLRSKVGEQPQAMGQQLKLNNMWRNKWQQNTCLRPQTAKQENYSWKKAE